MEDDIECDHCRLRIPSERYEAHLASACVGLFCRCKDCKQKMPVDKYAYHIKTDCPKQKTYCDFCGESWCWEITKDKSILDHYLNDCWRLRNWPLRHDVLRRHKRCPVCMRLALERKPKSKQQCHFCDPILVRAEVKPEGVSLHTAYELFSENKENDFQSKGRILQGGRFESKRNKH